MSTAPPGTWSIQEGVKVSVVAAIWPGEWLCMAFPLHTHLLLQAKEAESKLMVPLVVVVEPLSLTWEPPHPMDKK